MRLQSAIFHRVCADLSFNRSAWFPENWLTSLSVPFRDTLGAQSQVLSATMSRYATSLKKSYCSAKLFLGVNTRKNTQTCQLSTCPHPTFGFTHLSAILRTLVPQKRHKKTSNKGKHGKTSKHIKTIHNILSVENCIELQI